MAKMEAVKSHIKLLRQFRQEVMAAWTSMRALEVSEIVRLWVYFQDGVNIIF